MSFLGIDIKTINKDYKYQKYIFSRILNKR